VSVELVVCPLCRAEIHRHVAGPVETRISLPSRTKSGGDAIGMLIENARLEQEKEILLCEQACVGHYRDRHRLRLSLWRRFGWAWLMRWPTKQPVPHLGHDLFDPVQFIK
jgi:hypothetical protein